MISGVESKISKIYFLLSVKQIELDAFITENLCTGQIRLLKSPIAMQVLFIKKKNSSLNVITLSGAVHTRVEVHRMDSEISRLVELL